MGPVKVSSGKVSMLNQIDSLLGRARGTEIWPLEVLEVAILTFRHTILVPKALLYFLALTDAVG